MALNKYIGNRYVPLIKGEWDMTINYEPLTVVLYQGNSYTSRCYVPSGINITNETYWALSGNYNAQVEAYRKEVAQIGRYVTTSLGNLIPTVEELKSSKFYKSVKEFGAIGDGITDDTVALQNAINWCAENGFTLILDENKKYAVKSYNSMLGRLYCLMLPSNLIIDGRFSTIFKNEETDADVVITKRVENTHEIRTNNIIINNLTLDGVETTKSGGQLLWLYGVDNAYLQNIKLYNGDEFNLRIDYSKHVYTNNLTVYSGNLVNSDCVHLNTSSDCHFSNIDLHANGDDGFVLGASNGEAGCSNIYVQNLNIVCGTVRNIRAITFLTELPSTEIATHKNINISGNVIGNTVNQYSLGMSGANLIDSTIILCTTGGIYGLYLSGASNGAIKNCNIKMTVDGCNSAITGATTHDNILVNSLVEINGSVNGKYGCSIWGHNNIFKLNIKCTVAQSQLLTAHGSENMFFINAEFVDSNSVVVYTTDAEKSYFTLIGNGTVSDAGTDNIFTGIYIKS